MQDKKMRLNRVLAMVMGIVMLSALMAGCNATVSNPVVAKVGEIEISYSAFYSAFENYAQYFAASLTDDETNGTVDEQLQNMVFDALISSALPQAAAIEAGITLDETEEEELAARQADRLNEYLNSYWEDHADMDNATSRREAAIADMTVVLQANGYTYDEFLTIINEEVYNEMIAEKLTEQVRSEAQVSDEEVRAYYDEQVESQRAAYAENPAQYYTDLGLYQNYSSMQSMVRPLVAPEGYGLYKHVLIKNDEEGEEQDQAEKVAAVELRLETATIEALISVYGEDPGMTDENYKDGYILGEANRENYDESFADAALALEVGEITGPVESSHGIHFIKKVGLVSTDPVPFEEVEEEIYNYLLEQAKTELYNQAMEEWEQTVKIVKYPSRVSFISHEG